MLKERRARAVLLLTGALALCVVAAIAAVMLTNGAILASLRPAADPDGAREACQAFVARRLKAPATAHFSAASDTPVSIEEGADRPAHTVQGFVDSQNAFGALLRTTYTCRTRRDAAGGWELVGLDARNP